MLEKSGIISPKIEQKSEKIEKIKEVADKKVKLAKKFIERYGDIVIKAPKPIPDGGRRIEIPTLKKDAEIKCRNEELAGTKHKETGVKFEVKSVKLPDGRRVEGTFAKFDSAFDTKLPKNLYTASDNVQFRECNNQLKDAVEKVPGLAKKFNSEQLEQIKNGDRPSGYTWHHDAEAGKMQLVDTKIHAQTGHTGGRALWGNGSEAR
jgi:hypothetical protein